MMRCINIDSTLIVGTELAVHFNHFFVLVRYVDNIWNTMNVASLRVSIPKAY